MSHHCSHILSNQLDDALLFVIRERTSWRCFVKIVFWLGFGLGLFRDYVMICSIPGDVSFGNCPLPSSPGAFDVVDDVIHKAIESVYMSRAFLWLLSCSLEHELLNVQSMAG